MPRFVALLLAVTFAVVGVAGFASAGQVVVEAVYAAQYGSYPFFIALVYARGTEPLVDVQLFNGTTPIDEDRVQPYVLDESTNTTLFVVKKHGTPVVAEGDTLRAVVTDASAGMGELAVSCGSLQKGWYSVVLCRP